MKPKIFLYDTRIDFQNTYCLNLLVYTNAEIKIFTKLEKLFQDMWENEVDGVFIHIPREEKKIEDILFNLYAPVKKKEKKPIIIVQGISSSPYEEILPFENIIPVKDLVQTFAKKVGITAQYMASLNVGEYFAIPSRYLLPGWQVVKPVFYYDNEQKLRPLLKEGDFFTPELLEMLGQEAQILVKSPYRLELINSFTSKLKDKLDKEMPLEERVSLTDTAYQMVSSTMQTLELPETSLALAKSAIGSMEKIVHSNKTLTDLYKLIMEDKSSLRFKHAIISMFIGQHLLSQIPWASKQHEDSWTHLCFFHDIMLTKDEWIFYDHEFELENKNLDAKEKTIILNHARLAARVVSQAKELPVGIDTLIKQHHGSKMGDGLGKMSMSISPLAILFVIVENYTHFILTQPEKARSAEANHDFIESLFKKFPFPNYKKTIPYLRNLPLKA